MKLTTIENNKQIPPMRKVEAAIHINSTADNVLTAFTDANHLREWWEVDRCLIDLKENGNYILTWNITETGFKYIFSGIIRKYTFGKNLHIANMLYLNPERAILGPFELLIELTPISNGTKLFLKQWPYPDNKGEDMDWYFDSVKSAWPTVLKTLKKYLEQK